MALEAWIDKDTFRILQAYLVGRITPDEQEGITRTLRLSGLNQPVAIEPPQ